MHAVCMHAAAQRLAAAGTFVRMAQTGPKHWGLETIAAIEATICWLNRPWCTTIMNSSHDLMSATACSAVIHAPGALEVRACIVMPLSLRSCTNLLQAFCGQPRPLGHTTASRRLLLQLTAACSAPSKHGAPLCSPPAAAARCPCSGARVRRVLQLAWRRGRSIQLRFGRHRELRRAPQLHTCGDLLPWSR